MPARSEKVEIASPAPTDPAMMTRPRAVGVLAIEVNGPGLAAPSLPAAITTMIPCAVARPIAARSSDPMSEPPSEMLMTRALPARATSTPRAIASVPKRQPVSLSSTTAVAQVPGRSARATISVASNAAPCVPAPLRRPATVKATAVP